MRRTATRYPVLVLALVLGSSGLFAQTTWTGLISPSWSVASNWSAGVPNVNVAAIIPSGTPNDASTSGVTGAACASLTVNAGATLTVAPGFKLDVNGSVTVVGTVAGAGLVRIVTGGTSQISGAGQIGGTLEIATPPSGIALLAGNLTVNGDLVQTSGAFIASSSPGDTLTISGNALFQGGSLTVFNPGILDVSGNVTFAGTTVSAVMPTIQCGGNWVSNAAFAPTGGPAVFDGAGVQTLASAGTFGDLTIAASSSITTSTSLTVNGTLTVAGSFTVQSPTLHVTGPLSVSGVLSVTPGSLDVDGAATVGATGTLALGSGTHTFASNFFVTGVVSGSGTLVLDGLGLAQIASVVAVPNLLISKSATATVTLTGNMPVNGNLTQTSGTFIVAGSPGNTMAISGNAQFQGGSLTVFNTGILDVAGNVTFSGTTVSGGTPTIQCAGNWVSDAAFAPTSGTVVFDRAGVQTMSAAGAFGDLTVAASSSVTVQSPTLHVKSVLSVNGTLSLTPGTLDADGPVTVSATGTLALGSATHTIGSNLFVTGGVSASGALVLDGPVSAQIASAAALPSLQISKTGGATVTLMSNIAVNGNFTQTAGTFVVASSPNDTMAISGNAQFQGGSLTVFNDGILDVAGNVAFSGTTVSGSVPTIRCGGNWVSDAAFAPNLGTVELDGPGGTTIAHAAVGGTIAFPTLVISNGTRTMANDFTIASSSMTIAASGALAISGGRHLRLHLPAASTALTVNGALSVATNSELSMGPQTIATISTGGSLSLVGAAGQPAKLTGEAGGGYGLTVNGTLAANQFIVKEMGSGGMLVDFSATIAAAPNDFRNGTFDFRAGATAGSVLLDVRRQAPAAALDGLTFLNTPGAAGVFNVKTATSGVPISFTNWTGAFAGPAFESDPGNLIAWNLQPGPTVAAFVVVPGAELAEVVWHVTSSLNVTGYQIRRAASAAGPFSIFHTAPNTGASYGVVDSPLPANQAVFYAGYAVMSGGDVVLIGSGSTTPYSSAPPGNVKKVGGNGAFATIQDAINAATDPNSVVWVTPGTYDSFTIGATAVPSNLRILGDTAGGPVIVSTANGPIQIVNLPASSGVELSNLVVGSASSAQNGFVISNCACPVVLDEVDVACDASHTAISVSAAPAMAIQRSNVAGGVGIAASNGSYLAISRGSVSSLTSTGSTIEISTVTPGSVNVTPASSLIARTGLMPEINLPEFVRLSFPNALFLTAQPNAPFVIGASPRLGFEAPGSNAFEMPFLLDPMNLAELSTMFTDGLGQAVVGFEVSPIASLLGFSFTVQVVVGDPVTGTPRLSNVESMVCIP